ncbi:MAG: PIN domain-containing protein, partial [Chloroflexi bacterium]
MVAALLDTNIIVDLLRKYKPAENWLATQSDLAVTRVVWLEILEGIQNQTQQQRTITLLNDFELVEFTVSDFDWAVRQMMRFRLSHNVDAFDCLIAAPAHRLQIPLLTHNV